MANKHGGVGVREVDGGDTVVCASADPGGGYDTLCGRSLSDDLFEEVVVSDGARISCSACKNIWREARRFKLADFTKD